MHRNTSVHYGIHAIRRDENRAFCMIVLFWYENRAYYRLVISVN